MWKNIWYFFLFLFFEIDFKLRTYSIEDIFSKQYESNWESSLRNSYLFLFCAEFLRWSCLNQVWLHWRDIYQRIPSSLLRRAIQKFSPERSDWSVEFRSCNCSYQRNCDLKRKFLSPLWNNSTKIVGYGRWLVSSLHQLCLGFGRRCMVGDSISYYWDSNGRSFPI